MSGQKDRSQRTHLTDKNTNYSAIVDSDGHLQVDVIAGASGGVNSTFILMDDLNSLLSTDTSLSTYFTTNVAEYREFVVLMSVVVTGSPTDLTVKVQYSSEVDDNFRTLQNDHWSDLTWDDATVGASAWDHPALQGRCPAQYLRVLATMTTASSGTFTLSNCELHLKD